MDQPRTYLLGRRFRLRPGENTMGVDVIERDSFVIPKDQQDIDPRKDQKMTIVSTLAAIWRNLTTRQPGGFLVDKLRRVNATMNTIYQYWLYSLTPVELPQPRNFYGKDLLYLAMFTDQNPIWRNPRAGQWQIAYEDPSPNPRWRMKQIIEFVDERDIERTFQVSGCNMKWQVNDLPSIPMRQLRFTEPLLTDITQGVQKYSRFRCELQISQSAKWCREHSP